jgi:hypothetical protein
LEVLTPGITRRAFNETGTAYDEVKYLEGLRKKGSTLLNYVANHPA